MARKTRTHGKKKRLFETKEVPEALSPQMIGHTCTQVFGHEEASNFGRPSRVDHGTRRQSRMTTDNPIWQMRFSFQEHDSSCISSLEEWEADGGAGKSASVNPTLETKAS